MYIVLILLTFCIVIPRYDKRVGQLDSFVSVCLPGRLYQTPPLPQI